jgi:hypothetical protein
MIVEMVFLNIFWLNAFPHKLGISQSLSPRTIVTSLVINYTKHCKIEYGQYVQTHEKHDNTMTPRTIGAIALCPTGNQEGGYYFYSLMSGKQLHRTHWTELRMPAEVKDRVHALTRHACAFRGLIFTDSNGNNIDDIDEDDNSTYDPATDDPDSASDSDDDASSSTGSNYNSDDSSDDNSEPDLPADTPMELAGVANDHVTTGVDAVDTTGVDDTTTTEMNNTAASMNEVLQEP